MSKDPFSIYNSNHGQKSSPSSLDWEEGALFQAEEPEDYYETQGDGGKIWYYIVALVVVFAVLLGRLAYLEINKGGYYRAIADSNRLRTQDITAPRGIIYDSSGQKLVDNIPAFELAATPADLPADYSQEVKDLSAVMGFDPNQALQTLQSAGSKTYQQVSIMQNIPKDYALLFESKAQQYPGFAIVDDPIRQYVDPMIFSHLMGYTGKVSSQDLADKPKGYDLNDSIGKTGLEYSYEKYLKGIDGHQAVEVDAHGNVQNSSSIVAPKPGDSLVLNIDADLQRQLYKSLIAHNGNKKAAAVALDPETGQVLALISLPGYDDNLFSQGISQADYSKLSNDPAHPLFNRAISGTYPPGSTIKPVIASAGLQEGVINTSTTVYDNGDLVYNGYHFRGWDPAGLGPMNVRTAIAMSSDIFFYTVGGGQAALNIQGLGPERIDKYDYLFGMGQKLGIDLPGEQSGIIGGPDERKLAFSDPARQIWYPGDTYHISIGQGDMLVTPLQVSEWTAAVANGGTLYKPYIVDKVIDDNGNVVLQNKPTVIRAGFIDPANIEVVREGMRMTVTQGTAKSLQVLPVDAAGKTGTAQFDSANPNAAHAWFTAFAPYENPQIVITVLIEAGGEGSTAATPVVRETLQWWAQHRYKQPAAPASK